MHKFAHLADCHLGANKEPVLQKLEMNAFKTALDKCIEEEVDFIIISGDLFHVNIPDMKVTNEAVKKMKEVRDRGIPIYVIYGSHDYSPNETSMVDVLDSAGLIKKIVKVEEKEGGLKLEFFTDPKTSAKLAGISARKAGLEKNYFEILDRESLEKENGFKIFVFHSAITELKPEYLAEMESIPVSLLPRGFDYYAGGHIHQHANIRLPGYERIVYPGPLFAGYPRDLELSAKGEKRGFYIISFDEKVRDIKFVDISFYDSLYVEYDASNKNSIQAQKELLDKLRKIDVGNKLVVLRIKGELSGGKTSDISSTEIRNLLLQKGAIYVSINRYGLTSKEYAMVKVVGEDIPAIESKLFTENIGAVKVSNETLKGERGVRLATELLKVLRREPKPNEAKKDYEEQIRRDALEMLQLKEVSG
ncbi:MAG: DNA repair exonuclease [Nitrososphaeria archaeon]|nr:DNA repair exonuclease [Nitrososphaeria archaeon]